MSHNLVVISELQQITGSIKTPFKSFLFAMLQAFPLSVLVKKSLHSESESGSTDNKSLVTYAFSLGAVWNLENTRERKKKLRKMIFTFGFTMENIKEN